MKRILVVVAIALSLSVVATPAKAATVAELQAMIAQLTAQISALSGGSTAASTGYKFNTNLTVGSTGADVVALQDWLASKGFLSIPAGTSKGYFGQLTKTAVSAYQASAGLPATGFVGPMTREKLNAAAPVVVTPTPGTTPSTPSTLSGGEGELREFDTIGGVESSVDEGAEDEKVLGVEFKAKDSDVSIERVDVDIEVGSGGSSKLRDYIDSVSLWLDGKKIADADVSEGDEDSDVYSFRFSGLNGVVKEDDEAALYVAVNAVSNLDTGDSDVDLTVSVPEGGIRAVDAAGISDTYVSSTDSLEESFNIGARTAGDLNVTEASESPDTKTVQVDADSDTSDVTLFVLDLEADEQDITITDLPVYITSTGAGVGEIIKDVKLVQGSKTLDSVSISSTTATGRSIFFENVDLTVKDGETETVKVVATINDIEGAFSTGDSVYVSATSSALWDAEDEEGDQITLNHDVTGSVITFRSTGVMVTAGDMTQTVQANADATTDDQGVYSITFDVEAFEDTAYILLGSATRGGSSTTTAANYYVESSTNSYAATTTGSVSSEVTRVSGGSVEGSYVRINAGSKATFKLSVYFDAALTDLYRLQLQSVNFNDTAAAPDSSEAVTPLEDFQTTSVSVQN
ncbi:MAG: peptidoglycan-binding protein [Candidatus Pacebacteria bacterium]|nr:peptidoglycan-binding protein [Candidatus Paceibacterota bacterium]